MPIAMISAIGQKIARKQYEQYQSVSSLTRFGLRYLPDATENENPKSHTSNTTAVKGLTVLLPGSGRSTRTCV